MEEENVLSNPPDQAYRPTPWLKYFIKLETVIHDEQRLLCQLWEAEGRKDVWVAVPEEFVE